jgi:hypothetical protein
VRGLGCSILLFGVELGIATICAISIWRTARTVHIDKCRRREDLKEGNVLGITASQGFALNRTRASPYQPGMPLDVTTQHSTDGYASKQSTLSHMWCICGKCRRRSAATNRSDASTLIHEGPSVSAGTKFHVPPLLSHSFQHNPQNHDIITHVAQYTEQLRRCFCVESCLLMVYNIA